MYYLQSRYYDPGIGRFINADSAEYIGASGTLLSCNLFAYCENNPVKYIDATGRSIIAFIIAGTLAGIVTGVAYSTYNGYIGGKRGWELAWTALKGGIIGAAAGAALGSAVYGVKYAAMAIGAKLTAGSCGSLGVTLYSSWQKAEQALRSMYNGIKSTFYTPYGRRIVDCFSDKVAREAKYGYQSLSSFIQQEINKDAWLLQNKYVKSIEWHFYVSQATNKGGPSAPLLEELLKHGFKVIYH